MKTLFFIAALVGAIYLVMQSPAGQSWLTDNEPELEETTEIEKLKQESKQVLETVENQMTELAQRLVQDQQRQIDKLESRIAELENELIMGRISQAQQQHDETLKDNPNITQAEGDFVALPAPQGIVLGVQSTNTQAINTDKQIQRNRQARLQDIAEKMEMSSLQALVN